MKWSELSNKKIALWGMGREGQSSKTALLKHIPNITLIEIGEDNIVVFPNGNWVTNKIYYNSQNNTWLPLKETEIEAGYIEANNEYAEKLLGASNATIVYDLIKNARETAEAESDYIEEKVIE